MVKRVEIGRVYKDDKSNLIVIRGAGYTSRYGNGFFAEDKKGEVVFVSSENKPRKRNKKLKVIFSEELFPVEQDEWDKVIKNKKYQSLRNDLIWEYNNS